MKNKKIKKLKKYFFIIMMMFLSFIVTGCSNNKITSLKNFNGKNIGYMEGVYYVDNIDKDIKNANKIGYKSLTELRDALYKGEIDAFIYDEPILNYLSSFNNELDYLPSSDIDEYGIAFSKNEKCEKYLNEFNEFLNEIKLSGEFKEIENKWFRSQINSDYDCDYNSLNENNETIKIIISGDEIPFNYITDNNEIVGYEIELIYKFAKKYNYNLEITVDEFNKIIDGVSSNKYDIGMSSITITDERKEKVNFSNAIMEGAVSYCFLKTNDNEKKYFNKISDLEGSIIGILSGSLYDEIVINNIKDCKLKYYNSCDEIIEAINKNEIDAFIYDEPIAKYIVSQNDNLKVLNGIIHYDEYGYIFTKGNEINEKIIKELNEYISKLDLENELNQLQEKWLTYKKYEIENDYLTLPNINGRIIACANTDSVGEFSFKYDDKIVGYDIELITNFCKEYGYSLSIESVSFYDMIEEVKSGKYMMGIGCINLTSERKNIFDYSDPIYAGGISVITKKTPNDK